MKKTLLLGGLLLSAIFTQAQQRLALYEEFTGENCGPCAATNPGLWTLINTPANNAKVLMIKYQSPIPSAGPIYNANKVFTDNRMDFYSINSAPSASMNGGTPAHPANLTQANIDNASSGIAAFTINVGNPVYSADMQSFTASVTVTSTAAATYSNLKLRVALVESLHYATAPGSNGEKDFENVIRQMYPSADGLTIQGTWTAGQSMTYTVSGGVPSYVGSAPQTPPVKFLAAFVQKDDTKEVLQAAKTGDITITHAPVDVAITSQSAGSGLICQLPTTITPTVTIKNTGTTALTSATFYTKVGSGAYGTGVVKTFPSLAAGATTTVTLDPIQITTAGVQSVTDSVALPNSKMDYNAYDNFASSTAYVLSATPKALPITYGFEPTDANNDDFVSYATSTGYPIRKANTTSLGHNGSAYTGYFPCFSLPAGYVGYMIFPKAELPAGAKAVDFWVSYGQYVDNSGNTLGDKLELVYSTDCGTSWNSVWSKSNGDLATGPSTAGSTPFRPTPATWKKFSADVSNVPTGAYFAFKGTSGYGNDMFLDDIQVRTGAPSVGIGEVVREGSLSIYPNPASNVLNVNIDLIKASSVTYTIFNIMGQQIGTASTENLSQGNNKSSVDVSGLSSGMYYLNVTTDAGSIQQKFTKL